MFKRIMASLCALFGAVGVGFCTSTNALQEIEALASSTSAQVVTATIVGLAIFAALFVVRKLRSGVNAGAGR